MQVRHHLRNFSKVKSSQEDFFILYWLFLWLFQIKGVFLCPNSRHVHAGFKAIVPRSGRVGSEFSYILKAFTSATFETLRNLENSQLLS